MAASDYTLEERANKIRFLVNQIKLGATAPKAISALVKLLIESSELQELETLNEAKAELENAARRTLSVDDRSNRYMRADYLRMLVTVLVERLTAKQLEIEPGSAEHKMLQLIHDRTGINMLGMMRTLLYSDGVLYVKRQELLRQGLINATGGEEIPSMVAQLRITPKGCHVLASLEPAIPASA